MNEMYIIIEKVLYQSGTTKSIRYLYFIWSHSFQKQTHVGTSDSYTRPTLYPYQNQLLMLAVLQQSVRIHVEMRKVRSCFCWTLSKFVALLILALSVSWFYLIGTVKNRTICIVNIFSWHINTDSSVIVFRVQVAFMGVFVLAYD